MISCFDCIQYFINSLHNNNQNTWRNRDFSEKKIQHKNILCKIVCCLLSNFLYVCYPSLLEIQFVPLEMNGLNICHDSRFSSKPNAVHSRIPRKSLSKISLYKKQNNRYPSMIGMRIIILTQSNQIFSDVYLFNMHLFAQIFTNK